MKIYTKQGDGGKTTLLDPAPISKHDDAITAMGAIDELTSYLGQERGVVHKDGKV